LEYLKILGSFQNTDINYPGKIPPSPQDPLLCPLRFPSQTPLQVSSQIPWQLFCKVAKKQLLIPWPALPSANAVSSKETQRHSSFPRDYRSTAYTLDCKFSRTLTATMLKHTEQLNFCRRCFITYGRIQKDLGKQKRFGFFAF